MLGAIGLSPRQISLLLLSESAVFSVLGIVLGLFAGLGVATGGACDFQVLRFRWQPADA